MSSSVNKLVQQLISENGVMVFSKTYCPYCTRAKSLLTSLKVKFNAIELDTRDDGRALQDELLNITGQRTVPNIFIAGKHIGGCDSLTQLHEKGELEKLVAPFRA